MPSKTLHFQNERQISQLYCDRPKNLKFVEDAFDVEITTREDWLKVDGDDEGIKLTETLFDVLELARKQGITIRDSDFHHITSGICAGESAEILDTFQNALVLKIKNKSIVPKTINQKRYLQFISKYDITFGIGPAGTGKTYLAVAAALDALLNEKTVNKIILTRPAVESGEALGFLPGDLREKILPYLRPLYDALHDMIGAQETNMLIEKNVIEIAPLAYMRGRTLSNAFVILDEAQNTTPEQMMMFLTRLGDRAQMIVTGDITQVDLSHRIISGLKQSIQILAKVDDIKLFYFENKDVVRHPLVQDIIEAYSDFFSDTRPKKR